MADRNRDQGGGAQASGEGRGERFDEAQGGGRSWQDVSPSAEEADDLAEDQAAHQDRGQSEAEAEFNAEAE
ncbi:MAG: hypothetical protein QOG84_294 [Sphingomonadales bacterium]|jgi:hypothetical protein|nr:hypothetical protein [Sphingomonadales bacterium]